MIYTSVAGGSTSSTINKNTVILLSGETKCLYGLRAIPTKYFVKMEKEDGSWSHKIGELYYTEGQFSVEKCKSKTLEIK